MNYTEKQIANAQKKYNAMLVLKTEKDYDVCNIGFNEASRRVDYHNNIVNSILAGNKELEREWKLFFLKEEVKADAKTLKVKANKEASSDVLEPIKKLKKIGEFGKWLNNANDQFRKEHFSKKYTQESVNAFLNTL